MGRAARAKAQRVRKVESVHPPPIADGKTWHYGYHFVACIDVLGQGQELMKLTQLPHGPESKQAALAVLKRTAGTVRTVRQIFTDYIERVRTSDRPIAAPFTDAQWAEYQSIRNDIPFRVSNFSDTTVIALSLSEADHGPGRCAIGVWSAMYGIAGLMLTTLALGIPMRAGIDVERAVDVFPGEAYGPALVNAHRLEAQIADYPRAAVGRGLIDYLSYLDALSPDSTNARLATSTARKCRELLVADPEDRRPMLHMLSPALLEMGDEFRKPAQMAHRWATERFDEFRASGDEKHA